MKNRTPEIEFEGETYLFLTQQHSSLTEDVLRDCIDSLAQSRELLIGAIDFAIKGEVDSNSGLYSASTRRFRYLRYHHHRNCRGLTTLHKHACLV